MKNNINWNFDNTYSKLPEPFREKINPVKELALVKYKAEIEFIRSR